MPERSLLGGLIARWAEKVVSGGYAKENAERIKQAFFGGGSGENRVNAVLGEVGGIGGIAGILAGPGAKTANRKALELAKQLKKRGISDETIWRETARRHQQPWWLGHPDEVPRFEIDDSAAIYSAPPARADTTVPQQRLLYHPELTEAYPLTKDMPVKLDPYIRGHGSFTPLSPMESFNEGRIGMRSQTAADPVEGRLTNLHELQHSIQHPEGMSKGGNVKNLMRDISSLQDAQKVYKRLGGEMDARVVERRADLTPAQRAARPVWKDYDIPLKEMVLAEALRKTR